VPEDAPTWTVSSASGARGRSTAKKDIGEGEGLTRKAPAREETEDPTREVAEDPAEEVAEDPAGEEGGDEGEDGEGEGNTGESGGSLGHILNK